jgi:exonuclease VII small subunit
LRGGSAVVLGVGAGLAAVGAAVNALTSPAREAEEALKKLSAGMERVREAQTPIQTATAAVETLASRFGKELRLGLL